MLAAESVGCGSGDGGDGDGCKNYQKYYKNSYLQIKSIDL